MRTSIQKPIIDAEAFMKFFEETTGAKFVDAETGAYFTSSGLGETSTVREMTLLNDDNLSDVKFNQSTIGITTKKALESASSKIVTRMIKKQIFDH